METSLNRCLEATGANFGRASARFGPWAGAEERAEEEAAAPVYRSAKPPSSDMPRLTRGFSVHVPWLGRISGGTSAQKRLQTLAVFSFSLYGLLPLIAISWFVVLLCLINPLTLPFILGYLYFVFVADKAPTAGSRAPFLRQLTTWWHAYCDYFPMLLVKTAEVLSPRQMVAHPSAAAAAAASSLSGNRRSRPRYPVAAAAATPAAQAPLHSQHTHRLSPSPSPSPPPAPPRRLPPPPAATRPAAPRRARRRTPGQSD